KGIASAVGWEPLACSLAPPGARERLLGPCIDRLPPPLARGTPLGFARRPRSWVGRAQMGEVPHPLLVHATGVAGGCTGAVLMTAPDEDQEHSRPDAAGQEVAD